VDRYSIRRLYGGWDDIMGGFMKIPNPPEKINPIFDLGTIKIRR
jgi:hypothetical protein